MQRLLRLYLGQLDSCITAMVFAIFAAWLAPVLPMAPILSIYAPVGSPKNLAMQLLSLLCPRPLCLAGVKRSDLLRVPMELRPTLLLAEPDLQPAMRNILHAAAHRGFYVPSGDGVQELYGPKIIMTSKSPYTETLEAEVLQIALIPVSGQRPSLDKKTAEQVAEEFQARFLGYFLQNFSGAQVPTFDVSDLSRARSGSCAGVRRGHHRRHRTASPNPAIAEGSRRGNPRGSCASGRCGCARGESFVHTPGRLDDGAFRQHRGESWRDLQRPRL